jgi:hypothetical protein
VGISRDYPLKTRTSKQPIGEISGYEIIPSHPHKYPRSKQGLIWMRVGKDDFLVANEAIEEGPHKVSKSSSSPLVGVW